MKDLSATSEDVLKLLVGASHEEAARQKNIYLSRLRQSEITGQARMASMKADMPKNIKRMLDKVGHAYSTHPDWPSRPMPGRQ
jgi:hypothetical protein